MDGPHHDAPAQQAKDDEQQDALEDHGLTVIRFHHATDWEPILRRYPTLFGTPAAPPAPAPSQNAEDVFDPEDFDAAWRPVMSSLAATEGVSVEPGDEVMDGGRVVDLDLATVRKAERTLRLVDDAKTTADDVANALAEQGHRVLRARADEQDAVARILAALEEVP